MDRGLFEIKKDILDNVLVFDNEEPFDTRSAWFYLVTNAHSKGISHFNNIPCVEGQLVTSYSRLGNIFQWGLVKVKNFVDRLIASQMIEIEKFGIATRITIKNYDRY